jgi:hypothetical protein
MLLQFYSLIKSEAMAVMLYALAVYHWRANAIRKRGSGPYDDRSVDCFLQDITCFVVLTENAKIQVRTDDPLSCSSRYVYIASSHYSMLT